MKKIFTSIALICALLCFNVAVYAQTDEPTTEEATTEEFTSEDSVTQETEVVTEEPQQTTETTEVVDPFNASSDDDVSLNQAIKTKFIEGGWDFMSLVLICLILGLAVALERIIVLNLATTNSEKFIDKIRDALASGGSEAAYQEAKAARHPIGSVCAQGLASYKHGVDMVEKTVIATGSVEMSRLEKGLVWISLFIALAPMLGFMGTVIGMIGAFDAIEAAGDISPSLVAGGIKVALLTTVGGLIVAVILQVFYNYCVAKIDSLVTDMEETSIKLVDILIEHKAAEGN
ncbi:MAG: MotA/TolQ/ExbB proton channel family protein [Bernardetiaceae bacterium]|nr:MotA/TolQ/ExbB proton channel family protein [Bernardetiaceae bacterium]